jgi:hypothetical protein
MRMSLVGTCRANNDHQSLRLATYLRPDTFPGVQLVKVVVAGMSQEMSPSEMAVRCNESQVISNKILHLLSSGQLSGTR